MVTLDGAVISVETWHRSNKRCEPCRGAHGLASWLPWLSFRAPAPRTSHLPPPRDARKGMRTPVGSEFSSPVSVPIKARTRALGVSQASQEGFWRRLLKYLRAGTLCSLPFCPLLRGRILLYRIHLYSSSHNVLWNHTDQRSYPDSTAYSLSQIS